MAIGPSGTQWSASTSDFPSAVQLRTRGMRKHATSMSLRSGPPSAGTTKTAPTLPSFSLQRPKEISRPSGDHAAQQIDLAAGLGKAERLLAADQLHIKIPLPLIIVVARRTRKASRPATKPA